MFPGELVNPYQSFFDNFTGQYKSPEARLFAARTLLAEQTEHSFTQNGHPFLVAHWGEDADDLHDIAFAMYERKSRANQFRTRSVVVMTEGSDPILNDDPWLTSSVSFETGIIVRSSLYFQAGGRPTTGGGICRGVAAPFLNFRQSLFVTGHQRVLVEPDGTVEISERTEVLRQKDIKDDTEVPIIPVYLGTVSLLGDEKLYQRTRNFEERKVLWGNAASFRFVKALARKAGIRSSLAFSGLEHEGKAKIRSPLPDLSLIFSQLAELSPVTS